MKLLAYKRMVEDHDLQGFLSARPVCLLFSLSITSLSVSSKGSLASSSFTRSMTLMSINGARNDILAGPNFVRFHYVCRVKTKTRKWPVEALVANPTKRVSTIFVDSIMFGPSLEQAAARRKSTIHP
jgi:hypothetical protein